MPGVRRVAFFLADQAANRQEQPKFGVDGLDVAPARSIWLRAAGTDWLKKTLGAEAPNAAAVDGINKKVSVLVLLFAPSS
jgi:hypothetical protein